MGLIITMFVPLPTYPRPLLGTRYSLLSRIISPPFYVFPLFQDAKTVLWI
jgi:hypothetical protein